MKVFEVEPSLAARWLSRLAPDRPMLHALWLGGVGLALCLVGVVVALGQGPEFGPLWYPLLLCVTVLPSVWVGGRLVESRASRRSQDT